MLDQVMTQMIQIVMAICAVVVGLITVATLLIRQGKRMQIVKNIEKRVTLIESTHMDTKACEISKKACRMELVGKIENNKDIVSSEMSNLGVVVAETKVTIKEMCKEAKEYRKESSKRWIETNKILAKVSAKLEVD